MLRRWRITDAGSFIDGDQLSAVSLADLKLEAATHIEVGLEVKANARNVGGLNLFGRRFGNYAQDMLMRTRHEFLEGERPYKLK